VTHQIIRQPDGLLAVFSTGVDDWIIEDATAEELGEYYAERAAKEARESALETAQAVLDGRAREKYYQFTMTYEEACKQAAWTASDD
jgi:cell division protein FtsB